MGVHLVLFLLLAGKGNYGTIRSSWIFTSCFAIVYAFL